MGYQAESLTYSTGTAWQCYLIGEEKERRSVKLFVQYAIKILLRFSNNLCDTFWLVIFFH